MWHLKLITAVLFSFSCLFSLSLARYWSRTLDEELEYLQLADCPFQLEPIGCYRDEIGSTERALPNQILNGRDVLSKVYLPPTIQWRNYQHSLANLICQGAKRLFELKPHAFTDYIGVQFYGEIWADVESNNPGRYDRHGKSSNCIDGEFNIIDDINGHGSESCGVFTGKPMSNYVYKVTRYNKETICPYFESEGCWADLTPRSPPHQRPMKVYRMNERDPYASNWNGRVIDWMNWGRGYLGDLLCRCAELAKKDRMKYFSIQFYGECWLNNDESFQRDGEVTRCMDNQFKTCNLTQGRKCRAIMCAGQWNANKVYKLKQGPHLCNSDPCLNNGNCTTIGPNDYYCNCPFGFSGTHCQIAENSATATKTTPTTTTTTPTTTTTTPTTTTTTPTTTTTTPTTTTTTPTTTTTTPTTTTTTPTTTTTTPTTTIPTTTEEPEEIFS